MCLPHFSVPTVSGLLYSGGNKHFLLMFLSQCIVCDCPKRKWTSYLCAHLSLTIPGDALVSFFDHHQEIAYENDTVINSEHKEVLDGIQEKILWNQVKPIKYNKINHLLLSHTLIG